MKLKGGVRVLGAKPELMIGLQIANDVYERHGVDMRVTEITGGTHKPGSLHYAGLAADLGTHELAPELRDMILTEIRIAVGEDYDVIVEDAGTPNEHIHIEFQPKTSMTAIQ